MEFSCAHAEAEGAGGVCWVTGEIDLATADTFRVRAVEALEIYGPPLTIDLSGVGFLDSSGLKALLEIRAHARRVGHLPQIRLRGLAGHLARVLEITGVATLFVR